MANTIGKQELIRRVATKAGKSAKETTDLVNATLDSIRECLEGGEDVRLVGFGTFSVSKRKASTGRNPRTGEPMKIKASSQPKFKAGKALKDAVN